jgi:5'-methylthioadenosine phosphorylase
VGALNPSHRPGTVLVPEDYLSLQAPPTFALDERLHIIPLLDAALRTRLVGLARSVAEGPDGWQEPTVIASARSDIRDGGVYAETRGPRFETRAEIRLLADYADVVGMTAASEATLLQERGIASAILCIVDNYAHGIGARPLTFEAFERQLGENRHRVFALVRALMAAGAELASPAGPAHPDSGGDA